MKWEREALITRLLPHCGGDRAQAERVTDEVLRARGSEAQRQKVLELTGADGLLRDLDEGTQAREEGRGRGGVPRV